MNFAYFPLREFTEALGVTAKVKSRLEPFLEEVENYNMEWLFQMLMELYTYTAAPDGDLPFKFNALVALKLLLDTCELPVLLLTEVYFLPHVRRIATYQLQAHEKHRGLDFFIAQGYPKCAEVKKLGYNYVRLASEIVTMMAVVKPYRLFRDEELAEASEFVNVLEIMRAQQWREYDIFAFYQVEETQMRETFLRKLKGFGRCAERYYDFLDTYLDKFIRKEYSPKVLDPRKILEAGEVFACSHVLTELKELLAENRASIKTNVLRLFTDFVRWGYIRAAYLIECEGVFDELLRQARSAKGGRGVGGAFRGVAGSEQERRNLYLQVVRSLQIWAVCIPKNPMNLMEESKSSLIYKEMLQEQVEVPFSGNIKKIRDECEANLEKHQLVNLLIMKEVKKNDFDASKMRRTSSNLEELINMDKNMTTSIASLIKAKFINDLARTDPPSSPSSSSLAHSIPSNHHHPHPAHPLQLSHTPKTSTPCLEDITEPAKENREPRSKQAFNKHKTVSLNNLPFNASQTKLTTCLPQCEEENYNEDCEENSHINQLLCLESKQQPRLRSNCLIAQPHADLPTAKPERQPEHQEQEDILQFFEETVRTPTGSLTSSNFVVQVNKPSPSKEDNNPLLTSTPLKARKDKATRIQLQRLGFPARRNELTVAPETQRTEGRNEWIKKEKQRMEAKEGRQPDSFCWSCNQFLPDEDSAFSSEACKGLNPSRFECYLREVRELENRKALLRNKDILLKTNKIEVGFIFEAHTHQTALLSLFITPDQPLTKLNCQIASTSALTCSQRDHLTEIGKQKQRKLVFSLTAKPPYSLPRMALQYEMDGREYRHSIILPVSFNKFCKYSPNAPRLHTPIMSKTNSQALNVQLDAEKVALLLQDLEAKREGRTLELSGSAQYDGACWGVRVCVREGSVAVRCCAEKGEKAEEAQFLGALLQAVLAK